MRMKKMAYLLTSVLAMSYCAVVAGYAIHANKENSNQIVEPVVAAEGTYYSGIGGSLSGTDLLNALHTLNNQKRKKTIGYGDHRDYFKYTERCSSTPSNKMVGFYNNDLVSATWDNQATWNHEHIWPNSRGGGSNNKGGLSSPFIDADIHMVRPAAKSVNEGRGNLMYAASGAYDPGQYVNEYRGIAARIIFYCAIADTRLTLTENISDSSANSTMGKLSDLLKWNLQYAPSTSSTASIALQVEQNRNEVIYSRSDLQGNRNPFIDHPEYACKIWGNTNATTRQICGNPTPASTVSLDKTNASITVGSSTTITATSSNGGNITWSTNNSNVTLSSTTTASGASVTVTGAVAGTTTLTAKNSDNVSASCVITIAAQTEPLKLNLSSVNLEVGGSEYLIATTNDGSQVTYNFEDIAYEILDFNAIFTLNSGEPFKIKGLKDGTTTITVTSSNGGSATCQVVVGTGQYVEPTDPDKPDKKRSTINTPLVLGLGIGGGVILIAGLIVLIVLLVKKKPV